jgi:hypothetical protein
MKLIRTVTLNFLLLTSLSHGFAQRSEIIIIGGFTGSIIRQDGETSGFSRRYAPHFGILGGYGSSSFMIETGVLYCSQGTRINEFDFNFSGTRSSELAMNFLNVPVMVVVGPENFRFFAGPQFSFLTSAKFQDQKANELFDKSSIGLRYGFGFDLNSFLIQFQFANGLSDIYLDSDVKWINNSYYFTIGYKVFSQHNQKSDSKIKDAFPAHRMID